MWLSSTLFWKNSNRIDFIDREVVGSTVIRSTHKTKMGIRSTAIIFWKSWLKSFKEGLSLAQVKN